MTELDRQRLDVLRDPLPALAILAGLRLDLFTRLGKRTLSAGELARDLKVDPRRLEALLYALVSLDLLAVVDDDGRPRFRCTPPARRWLDATSPEFDGHDRDLAVRLWAAGLTVAESVQLGRPTAPHAAVDTAAFLQGLHPGALATGQRLAGLGWFDDCTDIVDVGGGSGGLAAALARHRPDARVRIVEIAEVSPITRSWMEREAVDVDVLEGDVSEGEGDLDDRVGASCDAVIACALLQTLSAERAAAAVRRMADWMVPGGQLIVIGMGVLDDSRQSPPAAALFNILFGTLYDEGRAWTVAQIRTWMQEAGLVDIEVHRWDDGRGVLRARRPS
jgi:phospholipid N-methyltransferase